jgi:MFS family permease
MRTQHVGGEDQAGYVELVRTNRDFRRLWGANVVSLLGDWFNTIALYTLVASLTDSASALGAVFIAKMLPWALASIVAGPLVDRYDRKRLMIGSDIARAVIVLGFLLVDDPSEVWLVYALIVAQVVAGSVFQPAKSASVPNITSPRELLTANALMAATWSTMLALGAALGGFAADILGLKAVFIIDSLTYLVSALFLLGVKIPQDTDVSHTPFVREAVRKVAEGWKHILANPRVGRITLAKATWALAGGGLVFMLTLVGEQATPERTSVGIGLLFAARGIGTGLGPVIARSVFRDQRTWPTVLGACIVFAGVFYAVIGFVPFDALWLVVLLVVIAHAASGANWVLATVMLQTRTEDRYRGRVFSTEWLFVMGMDALSILAASFLLDSGTLTLAQTIFAFACVQVICGLAWLAIVPRREREPEARPA